MTTYVEISSPSDDDKKDFQTKYNQCELGYLIQDGNKKDSSNKPSTIYQILAAAYGISSDSFCARRCWV